VEIPAVDLVEGGRPGFLVPGLLEPLDDPAREWTPSSSVRGGRRLSDSSRTPRTRPPDVFRTRAMAIDLAIEVLPRRRADDKGG